MAAVAQAPTIASDKQAEEPKKKIFGQQKAADLIIFRLVQMNDVKQREDTPLYPPYIRFPNRDIIVWKYKNEDGSISEATREIRWLPGEQTIFVDEQEKNGRKIPANILNNPNNRFEIINGDVTARPHEKTKIYFLTICNRNVESEYRTGTVPGIFARFTEEKRVAELNEKQEKQKEAMLKAFQATEEMVYNQVAHLGIPIINAATSASREYEAIRTDYRQVAMDNPVKFLEVFEKF